MRNGARHLFARRAPARRSICVVCMTWIALAGCASTRQGLPAPRMRDEGALRSEAQAAPQSAEPLYQMALLRYADGHAEGALQALGASLGRDPGYAPSLALFAKLMHDAGRSADALPLFERQKLDTLPEAVRVNVALLYADTGNTLKARKLLQGAAAGPCADAANANLAYLDLLDDRNDVAARQLQTALGPYAESPEVLNNVALARVRAGDVEGGAKLLREVAGKYPDFAAAQLNLALVLRNYLFDAPGAARAQAHFDAIGSPQIGDGAVRDFFDPGHEDAAPPLPPEPKAAEKPAPRNAAAAGAQGAAHPDGSR